MVGIKRQRQKGGITSDGLFYILFLINFCVSIVGSYCVNVACILIALGELIYFSNQLLFELDFNSSLDRRDFVSPAKVSMSYPNIVVALLFLGNDSSQSL